MTEIDPEELVDCENENAVRSGSFRFGKDQGIDLEEYFGQLLPSNSSGQIGGLGLDDRPADGDHLKEAFLIGTIGIIVCKRSTERLSHFRQRSIWWLWHLGKPAPDGLTGRRAGFYPVGRSLWPHLFLKTRISPRTIQNIDYTTQHSQILILRNLPIRSQIDFPCCGQLVGTDRMPEVIMDDECNATLDLPGSMLRLFPEMETWNATLCGESC